MSRRTTISGCVWAGLSLLAMGRAAYASGDGSIVGWGRNDYGQCNVPAPNTGFVAVAGGGYHTMGLKGRLLGDFDGHGDVDLSDFTVFQLCFGGSNNPPAPICPPGVDADLDGDGDVDLADFIIFQQNFTGSR